MKLRDLFVRIGVKTDLKEVKQFDNALNNLSSTLSVVAKGAAVVGAVFSTGIGYMLKQAGDIEQVQIAFETMLKSGEKAKALLQDITKFAAKTPFQLTGLIGASKQLLAVGVASDEVIKKMEYLGNIAAGLGKDKLPTVIKAFSKVRAKGKADLEALNMLMDAGMPILDELAKKYNVNKEQLFKMISAGKITFKSFDEAMRSMGTGIGLYAGLMEKQSKSLQGMISNVQDNITNLAIEIGNELLPTAKKIVGMFLEWYNVNKKMLKLKILDYIKKFILALKYFWKITKVVFNTVKKVVDAFGGFERVLKGVLIAVGALVGMQMLGALGSMLIALPAILSAVASAFTMTGIAAAIAQIKALAFPILVGAAFVALGLIIEDIYTYFTGGKSLIGKFAETNKVVKDLMDILGSLGKIVAGVFAGIVDQDMNLLLEGFKELGENILKLFGMNAERIGKFWSNVLFNFVQFVKGLWQSVGNFIADFSTKIENMLPSWAKKFLQGGISGRMLDIAKGMGTPMTTPMRSNVTTNSTSSSVNITAPMTFNNVPNGTSPDEMQSYTENAISKYFDNQLNNASYATTGAEAE